MLGGDQNVSVAKVARIRYSGELRTYLLNGLQQMLAAKSTAMDTRTVTALITVALLLKL